MRCLVDGGAMSFNVLVGSSGNDKLTLVYNVMASLRVSIQLIFTLTVGVEI